MKILNKHNFLFKYIIGFAILIIVGVFAFYFYFLTTIDKMVEERKHQIINSKKIQVKEIVYLTTQRIGLEAKRLSKSDLLTVRDIQEKILYELSLLKYDTYGYIFVINKDNIILSHPSFKYVGKNFTRNSDKDGVSIVPPMVEIAINKGEGYHKYKWTKPKSTYEVDKITFVKYFKDWDWVICSGAYLDDVETEVLQYRDELRTNLKYFLIIGFIIVVVFFIIWIFVFVRNLFTPLQNVSKTLDLVATGNFKAKIKKGGKDEIGTLYKSLNKVVDNLKKVTTVSVEIGKGNLDVEYEITSKDDELGIAIVEMRDSLIEAEKIEKQRKKEEAERNWATSGMAKFSDLLRQNSNDVDALSDIIIKNLVKYLDANQGGLFILNSNDNNKTLNLVSAYAYDRKKFIENKIELGEGLVGSCAIEKKTIYITDVPSDYLNIRSGLGEANPTSILIVPLKIDQEVFGVIEIASFKEIEKYQIKFLEIIGESIASTLSSVKINETTAQLLEQSQQQAEEMLAQEEEMRQNLEEMQATQEESARRESEMTSILKAINISSLVAEFDLDGNFININEELYKKLGASSKDEIIGRNHKDFYELAKDVEKYKEFGNKIKSGQTITVKNKVKTIQDKSLWLNESYSSILDVEGNIVKVINISTDITEDILMEQKIVQQNEEMKAQEEEMRQNFEELLIAQEEMNIKEQDIDYFKQALKNLIYKLEIDKDNNIIEIDDMFSEVLGYDKDYLIGSSISNIIPDIDTFSSVVSGIENNKTKTVSFKLKTKDKKEITYKLVLTPIYDLEGEYKKILILISIK